MSEDAKKEKVMGAMEEVKALIYAVTNYGPEEVKASAQVLNFSPSPTRECRVGFRAATL